MRHDGTFTDEETRQIMHVVRYKVRQLQRDAHCCLDEAGDLEQDIVSRILPTLPRFDPTRAGFRTFLNRTIDSTWLDLQRKAVATKRGTGRNVVSLQTPVPSATDGQPRELASLIDGNQHQNALGRRSRPSQELSELKMDLESELAKLPPEDRELLVEFARGGAAGAAEGQRIARGTVYRRLAPILAQLEDSSLRDYL